MRIGEIAKKAGVNTNTLRHYDKEGLLSPSSESESGYRLYTDKDMVRLIQILTMKQLGFTLGEIKNHLISLDTPDDMVHALTEHELAIEKKMELLSESLKEIRALKSEVEQMQTMDFRKYADILVNLQMGNDYYWAVKYMDDDLLSHLRDHFDEESTMVLMEAVGRLNAEAKQLQKEGVSPESESAQALAKTLLEAMLEATGGDERLLEKFIEFAENVKNSDGEADFLQLAMDAYLIKSGHDPFE